MYYVTDRYSMNGIHKVEHELICLTFLVSLRSIWLSVLFRVTMIRTKRIRNNTEAPAARASGTTSTTARRTKPSTIHAVRMMDVFEGAVLADSLTYNNITIHIAITTTTSDSCTRRVELYSFLIAWRGCGNSSCS
jgi:hypothetical protein